MTMPCSVRFTICGPTKADSKPPAMTQEIAFGRKLYEAVSAAAKR